MESSKKNKTRHKKVVIHRRKLSSTSNKSQQSFHHVASTGKHKRQISTLLKNNKLLALALEDARCDLSTKQKLLDDLYQYLNNMMFARFRMLEMQSVLKSFIQSFDEVLLLLKVDNLKCLNVDVPFRSCKNWKNKMKKIVESVEMHSQSIGEEIVNTAHKINENSLNQISCAPKEFTEEMRKNCLDVEMNVSEAQAIPVNISDKINEVDENQCLSNNTDNISSSQLSAIQETESQFTSVLSSVDCEGGVATKTPEKVLHLNTEDSGTPKLSIPLKVANTEAFFELKANSCNEDSSLPDENNSKMKKKPSSAIYPVKFKNSRIPKVQGLQFKKKMNTSPSDVFRKKGLIKTKVATLAEESNLNLCQRKEKIFKHEPFVILDKISKPEIFPDENIGESCKTINCRKTFVIKHSNAQENIQSSPCNRRKTFVKKPNDMSKVFESIKNGRETFTLSEHSSTLSKLSEEDVHHNENFNPVECVNIQNDVYLCTTDTTNGKGKSVSVESSEECQSNRKKKYINIYNKDYPHDLQQDNANYLIATESEKKTDNESAEEFNKKVTCETDNLQSREVGDRVNNNSAKDFGIIENKSNNLCCNKPLIHSSKLLLESPQSESESIPELENSIKELPITKTTPIRRQISKTKKLFLFDVNKSTPSKIIVDHVYENSSVSTENTAACELNVDCMNDEMKRHQDNESQKEKEKNISFACSDEENKINITDGSFSVSANRKKRSMKIPKGKRNKTKQKYKCANTEIQDFIASTTGSNCFKNKEPNEIKCTSTGHDQPVAILDKNKILNEEGKVNFSSKNESNLDLKCLTHSSKSDTSSEVLNLKNKVEYKTNMKRNVTLDDAIDDIISIPKKSKGIRKGKSEKKNENVCLDAKVQKCSKKTKNKVKMSGKLCKKSDKNTILVHADVHPVPSSCMPEIGILNKENEEIQELQVSVILNDILKSENNGMLNAYKKDQILHESKTSPLKTVLSSNSSNIPLTVDDIQNHYKNTVVTRSNSEEACPNRRKRSNVNYKEPSLTRKLRR